MKISEAVEKAMAQDKMIYRKNVQRKSGYHGALIKPTNSYNACIIVFYRKGKEISSCRNWNPTGDDLIAGDWELWDEQEEKYDAGN